MLEDVFLDTIEGCPETIKNRVPIPSELAGHSQSEAYVWAGNVSDTNRKIHSSIESGDYIFLYSVGEGDYLGGGEVVATLETDWFVDRYWGSKCSERQLVYLFGTFKQESISVKDVNNILGYSEIYHPHGLQRVGESRDRKALVDRFGL